MRSDHHKHEARTVQIHQMPSIQSLPGNLQVTLSSNIFTTDESLWEPAITAFAYFDCFNLIGDGMAHLISCVLLLETAAGDLWRSRYRGQRCDNLMMSVCTYRHVSGSWSSIGREGARAALFTGLLDECSLHFVPEKGDPSINKHLLDDCQEVMCLESSVPVESCCEAFLLTCDQLL